MTETSTQVLEKIRSSTSIDSVCIDISSRSSIRHWRGEEIKTTRCCAMSVRMSKRSMTTAEQDLVRKFKLLDQLLQGPVSLGQAGSTGSVVRSGSRGVAGVGSSQALGRASSLGFAASVTPSAFRSSSGSGGWNQSNGQASKVGAALVAPLSAKDALAEAARKLAACGVRAVHLLAREEGSFERNGTRGGS